MLGDLGVGGRGKVPARRGAAAPERLRPQAAGGADRAGGGGVRAPVQPVLRAGGMPQAGDAALGALPRAAGVPGGGGDRGEHGRAGAASGGGDPPAARWASWWQGPFLRTEVFVTICARLIGVDVGRVPASIVERLAGTWGERVGRMLVWLAPL